MSLASLLEVPEEVRSAAECIAALDRCFLLGFSDSAPRSTRPWSRLAGSPRPRRWPNPSRRPSPPSSRMSSGTSTSPRWASLAPRSRGQCTTSCEPGADRPRPRRWERAGLAADSGTAGQRPLVAGEHPALVDGGGHSWLPADRTSHARAVPRHSGADPGRTETDPARFAVDRLPQRTIAVAASVVAAGRTDPALGRSVDAEHGYALYLPVRSMGPRSTANCSR